jgi:hypothetical protein
MREGPSDGSDKSDLSDGLGESAGKADLSCAELALGVPGDCSGQMNPPFTRRPPSKGTRRRGR